tara:strand:+ start:353 stop:556 length:204 start_codon:yes stop_codon:yes gene_type:complete
MINIPKIKNALKKAMFSKSRGTYSVSIFEEAMTFDSATADFLRAVDTLESEDFEFLLKIINELKDKV